MPFVVRVPTSHRDARTYEKFFHMYAGMQAALADGERQFDLDFSDCIFLHQHAVAFLGGAIRMLQSAGSSVSAIRASILPIVHENLRKNGFLKAMGLEAVAGGRNVIPFKEDSVRQDIAYLGYLRDAWLGRGWVNISDRVADAIANAVFEAYANAFEHGESALGVFSCGQFYPNTKEIALAFVDFGLGIPGTVRTVPAGRDLDDGEAISWALIEGNTSKPGNRGVGLSILRSFVELNGGYMDVVSHRGHIQLDGRGTTNLRRNRGFHGTVFNITFKANETRYVFLDEIDAEGIF